MFDAVKLKINYMSHIFLYYTIRCKRGLCKRIYRAMYTCERHQYGICRYTYARKNFAITAPRTHKMAQTIRSYIPDRRGTILLAYLGAVVYAALLRATIVLIVIIANNPARSPGLLKRVPIMKAKWNMQFKINYRANALREKRSCTIYADRFISALTL